MNNWTRFSLVVLRLAIGWHFFFAGLEKIKSVDLGPTQTNRPWSSEGYFREATGPLATTMRQVIGDLDQAALGRLSVQPVPPGQDPAKIAPRTRISPALEQDWDAYLERFAKHYQLDEEQSKLARAKLDQSKDQAVLWLLSGTSEVQRSFPNVELKLKKTTPERIQEYRDALQAVQERQDSELPAFQKDVLRVKLRAAKADVQRLRTALLADLEQPMKEALSSVLRDEQKKAGPVSAGEPPRNLQWLDAATRYGLTAIGACLLLGLFSRLACLSGALFLLSEYLVNPPFPWLPESPRAEMAYFFVNKNLVEMLALLVLATTHSGRWLGLDGVLYCLMPWRWRRPQARLAAGPIGDPRSSSRG